MIYTLIMVGKPPHSIFRGSKGSKKVLDQLSRQSLKLSAVQLDLEIFHQLMEALIAQNIFFIEIVLLIFR